MKKSILMAIVALALLAAPAFAGDYSIVGNIDWGFGTAIVSSANDAAEAAPVNNPARIYNITNDYTQLGFNGSIDANNSLSITTEYGQSGSAGFIDGPLAVEVTDFNLTTNILGAFGVTDLPVTLFMSAGHGRLNLHNRFQQWTGWEIKRWKDNGAAHWAGTYSADDPGVWQRANYLKLTVGIVNMVNVTVGVVPSFGATKYKSDSIGATVLSAGADVNALMTDDAVYDIPFMIDVWTTGVVVGPVALDIAANLRADCLDLALGAQVTANMNFGDLSLMAFLGEDYQLDLDDAGDADLVAGSNAAFIAIKPSYNFGAGSVSLGLWFGMTTTITDGEGQIGDVNADTYQDWSDDVDIESNTQYDLAVDVALSFSTFTIYGGVIMTDLSDVNENDSKPMKYDIGVKNAFGAATVGIGITGMATNKTDVDNAGGDPVNETLNQYDIGAADGSGNNWLDVDGQTLPTLYFRVNAWY